MEQQPEQQPETAPETAYDFTHNTEEADTTDAHIAFPGSPEDEIDSAKRQEEWRKREEELQKILTENEIENSK